MRRTGILAGLVLAASVAGGAGPAAAAEGDPLEPVNRKIFWFNDKVDVYVLEPVARQWVRVVPDAARASLRRFFGNLREPIVAVNDVLQGKPVAGASDLGRFGVNTTVGVLGLFDPAGHWGLDKHDEDFGQTLGVWGVPPGPYLVLPLLGPSSIRDTGGLVVDSAFSVYPFFTQDWWILVPTGARVVEAVNTRGDYLDEVEDLKRTALDYYTSVRNGYQQRRTSAVGDHEGATEEEQQDLYHPAEGAP